MSYRVSYERDKRAAHRHFATTLDEITRRPALDNKPHTSTLEQIKKNKARHPDPDSRSTHRHRIFQRSLRFPPPSPPSTSSSLSLLTSLSPSQRTTAAAAAAPPSPSSWVARAAAFASASTASITSASAFRFASSARALLGRSRRVRERRG